MSSRLPWLQIKESFPIPAPSYFYSSHKVSCFINNTRKAAYSWIKGVLHGKCEESLDESDPIWLDWQRKAPLVFPLQRVKEY